MGAPHGSQWAGSNHTIRTPLWPPRHLQPIHAGWHLKTNTVYDSLLTACVCVHEHCITLAVALSSLSHTHQMKHLPRRKLHLVTTMHMKGWSSLSHVLGLSPLMTGKEAMGPGRLWVTLSPLLSPLRIASGACHRGGSQELQV